MTLQEQFLPLYKAFWFSNKNFRSYLLHLGITGPILALQEWFLLLFTTFLHSNNDFCECCKIWRCFWCKIFCWISYVFFCCWIRSEFGTCYRVLGVTGYLERIWRTFSGFDAFFWCKIVFDAFPIVFFFFVFCVLGEICACCRVLTLSFGIRFVGWIS